MPSATEQLSTTLGRALRPHSPRHPRAPATVTELACALTMSDASCLRHA